jgi:hypothetical protein
MVFFKSCPRCYGDRSLESDQYGWYLICLPCGYVTYPDVAGTPESVALRPDEAGVGQQAPVTVLYADGAAAAQTAG